MTCPLLQEHRELMAWIKRMMGTVTAESLPKDVEGCEALSARYVSEIRSC